LFIVRVVQEKETKDGRHHRETGQTYFFHMRVSVPNIPQSLLSSSQLLPSISVQEATERVANFLAAGNVTVLTGAGVSVDSGIRAYRGKDGRYMNPNYK
jgi:NAD+-dependent protein deacetylase sirtuin 4